MSLIQGIVNTFLPYLDRVPVIRVILACLLVFFLPGFAWTLVIFYWRRINLIERAVLSIGISIASITLSVFALNEVAGVRITGTNSLLVILAITVIPFAWYYLKRCVRNRSNNSL